MENSHRHQKRVVSLCGLSSFVHQMWKLQLRRFPLGWPFVQQFMFAIARILIMQMSLTVEIFMSIARNRTREVLFPKLSRTGLIIKVKHSTIFFALQIVIKFSRVKGELETRGDVRSVEFYWKLRERLEEKQTALHINCVSVLAFGWILFLCNLFENVFGSGPRSDLRKILALQMFFPESGHKFKLNFNLSSASARNEAKEVALLDKSESVSEEKFFMSDFI